MGATKDGKIVAAEVWMAYEAGAFPGSPVGAGAMTIIAPYNIPQLPDRRLRRGGQSARRPRPIARRARPTRRWPPRPSSTSWPRRCGIDPIDFRLAQCGARKAAAQTVGPPYKRIGFIETLEAIKNSPHYQVEARRTQSRRAASPPASGSTPGCNRRRPLISIPMAPPA